MCVFLAVDEAVTLMVLHLTSVAVVGIAVRLVAVQERDNLNYYKHQT